MDSVATSTTKILVCTAVSCQIITQWYYAFFCQANVNYFSLVTITNLLSIGTSQREEQQSSLYPKSMIPPPPPPQRMTGGRQNQPRSQGFSSTLLPSLEGNPGIGWSRDPPDFGGFAFLLSRRGC